MIPDPPKQFYNLLIPGELTKIRSNYKAPTIEDEENDDPTIMPIKDEALKLPIEMSLTPGLDYYRTYTLNNSYGPERRA